MTAKQSFKSAADTSKKPTPFSLRLSLEERAMLDKMAGNRPLGAFIRARLFGEQSTPRKLHQRRAGVDHAALAKALALLGQSRIASNLNQLAKAANIGALPVDEETERDLHEACQAVCVMRHELISALGLKSS
ncbi:MAG: plasmid mobilization relaxosome protein MobC [Pseudomonadota bacterium]